MWHSFEKYSDLCDLINEIFKTGNWGVTNNTKPYENKNQTVKNNTDQRQNRKEEARNNTQPVTQRQQSIYKYNSHEHKNTTHEH